ncbi:MAG: G5 domain-containing protein, partial [Anaerococcus sp.]|nr:G5 domain-containing protein [Anaerococcus sp.]
QYGEVGVTENINILAVDEIVRVATATDKETTSKVETYETDIPYSTKIEENPNLEAGTRNTKQQGVKGKKVTTVTQTLINGKAYGEATVKEEITQNPTEEIIEIGTRVDNINTSYEYQVTQPIPFETKYEDDSSLPAGEEKISQEGKDGLETITYVQELVNGKAPENTPATVKNIETTKQPVTQIIKKGTGVVDKTVTEKTESISFKTQYIDDPNLPAGEDIVIREGEVGSKTITTTQPTLNGENYGEASVVENITKAPIDKIVRRGTATAENITNDIKTFTEEIPYQTVEKNNSNLPDGVREISQEGKNGKKVTTITQQIVNGKPYGEAKTNIDITEAKDEIIQVGTGGQIENVTTTETQSIEYKTEFIDDPSLPADEEIEIRQGINGEKTITTVQPTFKGNNYGEATVTEEITTPVQNRIVRRGTAAADQITEDTKTFEESIAYKTESRENPYLPKGTKNVIQEGKNGKKTITITQKLVNGKAYGKANVTESRDEEPISQIIEIGTASIEESIEETPYTTKIIYDETKPGDYREVETAGVKGRRKVVTITPGPEAGNPTPLVTYETLEEAREEVVVIGTKKPDSQPPKETVIEIRYEDVDFNIDYIKDPNRYVGDDKLIQKGQKGKRKIITTTVTVDGKTTEDKNIEDIEEVIDEKWLVGTKKIDPEIQPELP